MTDSSSTSAPLPGLGDLLMLVSGSNPINGITKAMGQFQRGVGDFLHAVENFNDTMEQLNAIAGRVNRLLDDVEPPIRALMPQVTRTLLSADAMVTQMNALPKDIGEVMGVLADLVRRLQPLGQIAESAGGMFGLKQFTNLLPGASRSAPPAPAEPPPPPPPPRNVARKSAAKPSPAKKSPARKAAAKKPTAKKSPAKKAAARPR